MNCNNVGYAGEKTRKRFKPEEQTEREGNSWTQIPSIRQSVSAQYAHYLLIYSIMAAPELMLLP